MQNPKVSTIKEPFVTKLGLEDSIEFKSLYFSAEEIYTLRNYRYIGSDEGYLYKWFFNPLANYVVNFIPTYVAPNTLTLIGFAFTVSVFATVFGIYGIQMDGPVDRWWYFYGAFAFLGYRLFDEMDGKQARRTRNSSVLGMLLDHGCDSFSCLILLMSSLKAYQMGSTLLAFLTQIAIMGAFLFIVLEEYYKGYFKLGPGNAVSDGSALVVGAFLFTGVVGYEFWAQEVEVMGETFRYAELIIGSQAVIQVFSMFSSVYEILKDHGDKRYQPQSERLGHPLKIMQLADNIFGFLLFSAIFLWAGLQNGQEYIKQHFFLFALYFGTNMCHLIICGIMDHACKTTFTYWKNLIFMMNLAVMFFHSLAWEIIGEKLPARDFLVTMLVITLFCQLFLYLRWIVDLTYILKIRMFFVKPVEAFAETEDFTSYPDEEDCSSYTSNNPQSRSMMTDQHNISELRGLN